MDERTKVVLIFLAVVIGALTPVVVLALENAELVSTGYPTCEPCAVLDDVPYTLR